MPEGIKDKVAIVGMGLTKFKEHWDLSAQDLLVDAVMEALQDAGIQDTEIDSFYLATCFDEIGMGKSALPLSLTLKLPFKPVTRVENFCASGTEALRNAVYAVASGAADIAMAVGAEKLKDIGYGGLPEFAGALGTQARQIYPTITAPGAFAMMATAYFAKYGIDPETGKRLLAMVSKKSHDNGLLNEKAHLRKQVTLEQIIKSPMVAWPLGLFDCSGVSDGAAAAIVARADIAKKLRPDPIWVKAMQIALSSGEEFMYQDWDGTHIISTEIAAMRAYAEAGIKDPRRELSVLQLHDCFSITELVTYEDIHVSERGKAGQDIENGFFNLDGELPAQTDGGLKCFGHPIAASGLRMMYEIYKQLQGKAEKRQVKNPRLGLTHNLGGFPAMNISSISIVGNEEG